MLCKKWTWYTKLLAVTLFICVLVASLVLAEYYRDDGRGGRLYIMGSVFVVGILLMALDASPDLLMLTICVALHAFKLLTYEGLTKGLWSSGIHDRQPNHYDHDHHLTST
jgi:hypothetical protein